MSSIKLKGSAFNASSDEARMNENIFLVRVGSSHQPTRSFHLLLQQRSYILEALVLKNSIVI
jgi:hypothetical protein